MSMDFGSPAPDDPQESELAYWLEKAAPGAPEVLDVLVERYGLELYRLAYILLLDERAGAPQEREILDLVGRTLARALAGLPDFRGQESVRGWLYGLALQSGRAYLRKRRWFQLRGRRSKGGGAAAAPGEAPEAAHTGPEGQAGEAKARIWACVARLDERSRLVVALRYGFHLTLQDIARIQGLEPEQVRARWDELRQELLEEPGVEEEIHPEILQKIQASRDGVAGLSAGEWEQIKTHLEGCRACRRYSEQTAGLERALSATFETYLPRPDFDDPRRGAVVASAQAKRRRGWFLMPLLAPARELLLLGAIVLTVLALGWFFSRQDTRSGVPLFPETPAPTPTSYQATEDQARVVAAPERDDLYQREFGFYIDPTLSADGRWMAFTYYVNSVVGGRTVPRADVLIYDRESGDVARVDLVSQGLVDQSALSQVFNFSPVMSADGRWVVFISNAGRFSSDAEGSCQGIENATDCADIYLFNRRIGEVKRISTAPGGVLADSASWGPAISAKGRWITYWSAASDLGEAGQAKCTPPSSARRCWDVLVYDRETGRTERITIGRWFWEYEALSLEAVPISDDGRWLAITLHADDLVADALGLFNQEDVFLYDRQNGTFEPVNVAQDGTPGKGPSSHAVMSSDGRLVAFASLADNLVTGDANRWGDVFVRDRLSGVVEYISATTHGGKSNGSSGGYFMESSGWGQEIDMSPDGRYITYISAASNLVDPDAAPCSEVNWMPCVNIYSHDRSTSETEAALPGIDRSFSYLSPAVSGDGRWVSVVRQDVPCLSAPVCSTVLLHDRQTGVTLPVVHGNRSLVYQAYTAEWRSNTVLQESYSGVNSLVFSPDGRILASGANDGAVRLARMPSAQVIETFQAHNAPVTSLAFSPDGRLLASGSHDGRVVIYDMEVGALRRRLPGYGGAVLSLAFSPDGRTLSVGAIGGVWSLETRPETYAVLDYSSYPGDQINSLAYSPDGKLLATGHKDGSIWLQRASDGRILLRLAAHQDKILSLDFSPDGAYLAAGSADSDVTLWRIEQPSTGQLQAEKLFVFQHADWVNDLAFSPDGGLLVVASFDSGVRFWQLPAGELLSTVLGDRNIQATSLDISPDGNSLAVGSSWGGITLWERISP